MGSRMTPGSCHIQAGTCSSRCPRSTQGVPPLRGLSSALSTKCLRAPNRIHIFFLIQVNMGIVTLYSFGVLKQVVDFARLQRASWVKLQLFQSRARSHKHGIPAIKFEMTCCWLAGNEGIRALSIPLKGLSRVPIYISNSGII